MAEKAEADGCLSGGEDTKEEDGLLYGEDSDNLRKEVGFVEVERKNPICFPI